MQRLKNAVNFLVPSIYIKLISRGVCLPMFLYANVGS